jgi:hypothetical protein
VIRLVAQRKQIGAQDGNALDRVTADDRDYQDAVGLGLECGVTTVEGLKNVYRRFFGSEHLPITAELRLTGLVTAIRAKLR